MANNQVESALVTTKGQLVVPARIRRRYGIKPGTRVTFIERNGEIVFQPITREYIHSIWGMFKDGPSLTKALLETRAEEKAREDRDLEKHGSR